MKCLAVNEKLQDVPKGRKKFKRQNDQQELNSNMKERLKLSNKDFNNNHDGDFKCFK